MTISKQYRPKIAKLKRLQAAALVVFVILVAACTQANGQKLHLLVVSDQSEWAKWGEHLPNITTDAIGVGVTFEEHIPRRQLNLQPYAIEMDGGSPAGILREIDRFKIGPNDTFMFYFTGHGEADSKGHYLNLEKGKLYRSKIKEALLKKRPRLAVIITDCCNVRGDKFAYFAPHIEPVRPRRVSPLFQSLFFKPSGVVDINGSSPGESAYFFVRKNEDEPPEGSLFTNTLLTSLRQNSKKTAVWDQLLSLVSVKVHDAFRANYPTGVKSTVKGQQKQNGQNVYAIAYPGMPEKKGPRTGLTVRDHSGTGALISAVRADYPGTRVFDLKTKKFVSLKKDQVIVAANGQAVANSKQFSEIVKTSPQVLRLTVFDPSLGQRTFLMRLRY